MEVGQSFEGVSVAKSLIKVDNTGKVIASIRGKSLKGVKVARLDVGFDTPYAARVHEDLTMNHPNGGQAKFLEQPARRYARQLGEMFYMDLVNHRSMSQALLKTGNFLLDKAKELVPVDTGRLRASGFARVS